MYSIADYGAMIGDSVRMSAFVRALRQAVTPGAVVIDIGTTRTDDGLKGDVDFDAVREVASLVTPVPGGVGPMTIATLLQSTVKLAWARARAHA